MLDSISAELLKFRGHRATWGLVWIWPIGVVLLLLLAIAIQVAKGEVGQPETGAGWIADAVGFWTVPAEPLGRYLICAFVAVVFAGEYGWNTWKLIVPHRARHSLIAAKYVVALVLLACGFALGAALFNLLSWLKDLATGTPRVHGRDVVAVLVEEISHRPQLGGVTELEPTGLVDHHL